MSTRMKARTTWWQAAALLAAVTAVSGCKVQIEVVEKKSDETSTASNEDSTGGVDSTPDDTTASTDSSTRSRRGVGHGSGQGSSGSESGSEVAETEPTVPAAPVISYASSSRVLTRGVSSAAMAATNTGGVITSCSSTPSLPAGLVISNSCVISGTPTVVSGNQSYTITATNAGGSGSITISVSVHDIEPSLSFSSSSYTLKRGVLVSGITPSNSGGALVSCSTSPALPAGLAISAGCIISGTPSVTLSSSVFTVTGVNSGGSDSKNITLTVHDSDPSFTYPVQSILGIVGTSLNSVAVTNTGGAISSCSASPALPDGVTLSSSCAISGTPSLIRDVTVYTITASSSGGSSSTTISITVVDRAPSISFSPTSQVLVKNTAITAWSSMNSGGDATVCDVSPALPTGLSVSLVSGNCSISGTPGVVSPAASYTVTGSNSGGSSSEILSIAVEDEAPTLSIGAPSELGSLASMSGFSEASSAGSAGMSASGSYASGSGSGGVGGCGEFWANGYRLYQGVSIPGITLAGVYLSGACLQGANFSGGNFQYTTVLSSNLSGADLSGINLWGTTFQSTDLSDANLSGMFSLGHASPVGFYAVNMTRANLQNVLLSRAYFNYVQMTGADLQGAQIQAMGWSFSFNGVDLSQADLRGALITGSGSNINLNQANLEGADLSGLHYPNTSASDQLFAPSSGIIGTPAALPHGWCVVNGELVQADSCETSAWSQVIAFRQGGPSASGMSGASYAASGAGMSSAAYAGASGMSAAASGIGMSAASGGGGSLSNWYGCSGSLYVNGYTLYPGVYAPYAQLTGQDLNYACLEQANFTGATFAYASMYQTKLAGANLSGANLSAAAMSYTDLAGANLTGAYSLGSASPIFLYSVTAS
ncbi:MAG: pentapeptide repeat-containing protein, partial [Bdellovibrionales bacterium]|nr:pentapeptide repeat-containing protein [Bdellovibrionales bacterium]